MSLQKELNQKIDEISRYEKQDWPDPQSILSKAESEPYPIAALPNVVRLAVEEVESFVKAPVALVASSALASLSLACQAHVDVKRAERLQSPTGLFLLTIADSGERKTTCDAFFTQAIRDFEAEQAELAKSDLKKYAADFAAWEAEREGVILSIKEHSRKGKPVDTLKRSLKQLEDEKPDEPRVPRLLHKEITPEKLAFSLAKSWPSAGLISSEAGIVFGSHGMGNDSIMRNLALYNILWDGGDHSVGRRTSESFTVRGARLTMALQVQKATIKNFFDKSGQLARGTGFLARFLISHPESTQGHRPFTEAPQSWPCLSAFNRRISTILNETVSIDENGSLTPALLQLSPEAKAAWVDFHDKVERELAKGGDLYDVRDVASKAADNAARLAAIFHWAESMNGVISHDSFLMASEIVSWHLSESQRFFNEIALPLEVQNAIKVNEWIVDYCKRQKTHLVNKRQLLQFGPVRSDVDLIAALRSLEELDRIRLIHEGKRKIVKINPNLLATPATPATHDMKRASRSVASVAPVAVANPIHEKIEISINSIDPLATDATDATHFLPNETSPATPRPAPNNDCSVVADVADDLPVGAGGGD